MYEVGRALRQQYQEFLDYDPNSTLALSSNALRCRKSLEATLQGLYEITSTVANGHRLAEKLANNDYSGIGSGCGNSDAWKHVRPDTSLVPDLGVDLYPSSLYAKNHPSELQEDLGSDEDISKLPGIQRLKQILKQRYDYDFNLDVTSIWIALECELYLDRTRETLIYMDHFDDWIHEPVAEDYSDPDNKVSLDIYDIFEEIVVLAYLGNFADKNTDYIVISPIMNIIFESQAIALGESVSSKTASRYRNKKLVISSTHDTILMMLLYDLGILQTDGATFVDRLLAAKKSGSSGLKRFIDGLGMCHFGLSLRFELVQLMNAEGNESPVIRLFVYSEPDPRKEVEWAQVPLGDACRRRYTQMYPEGDLASYYSAEFVFSERLECPRKLFQNVTSPWIFDQEKYDRIFNDQLGNL